MLAFRLPRELSSSVVADKLPAVAADTKAEPEPFVRRAIGVLGFTGSGLGDVGQRFRVGSSRL